MSRSAHRQPSFRERLVFDANLGELRDGDTRYLLIRHDSLMGMFARLPVAARRLALAALCDAVATGGGRSAARYMAGSARGPDDLLSVIETTALELGWGRWTLERSGADALRLDVANSPFATGAVPSREPVCAPIAGMLRAVASLIFAAPVAVEETSCAASGDDACRFRAWVVAGTDELGGG